MSIIRGEVRITRKVSARVAIRAHVSFSPHQIGGVPLVLSCPHLKTCRPPPPKIMLTNATTTKPFILSLSPHPPPKFLHLFSTIPPWLPLHQTPPFLLSQIHPSHYLSLSRPHSHSHLLSHPPPAAFLLPVGPPTKPLH